MSAPKISKVMRKHLAFMAAHEGPFPYHRFPTVAIGRFKQWGWIEKSSHNWYVVTDAGRAWLRDNS